MSGHASEHGPELPVGYVIAGKYRIEKVIGQGGMGLVYAARHMTLEEPVAIKVLRPSMMGIAGMVARFIREARAASRIRSPYVARVTDVDTLPSGVPYMVMEHLEGIDLGALRRTAGPLNIHEAATYIAQACDAIAEAHGLGIIHRDLKPSNLFLARRRDERRTIKVLDFGISKVENLSEEDATKPGIMMGSPKYMSPEQMRSIRDVDIRTDIWALGAILYDMLAGRPPFIADNMAQVCTMVLHGQPPSLRSLRPEVPIELQEIVEKCLQKKPEDRFATADDLAHALSPFYDVADASGPVSTRMAEPSPITVRPPRETAPTLDMAEMERELAESREEREDSQQSAGPISLNAPAPTPVPAPRRSRSAAVAVVLAALALGATAAAAYRQDLSRLIARAAPVSPAPAEGVAAPPESEVTPVTTVTADPEPPASAEAAPPADTEDAAATAPTSSASSPGEKGRRDPGPWLKRPAKDPFGGSRN
jgi:serine/threonine-protein kinase